jgi:3-phosphoshikimate 1-carboxyvinyltransferase
VSERRFGPSGPLAGALAAPPDKSISHRAALLGAISEGRRRISGYLDAADTRSTLAAARALGARIEERRVPDGLELTIEGAGLRGGPAAGEIDAGNAGTLIRLLCGLLAGREGTRFRLDGDESIRRRPMGRVIEPLSEMGARISSRGDGLPPLLVEGRRLRGIEYRMPIASAQVKSCLLFAGLLAEGATIVHESAPTRDHSERMLRAAGVSLRSEPRSALPTAAAAAKVTVEPAEALSLPDMRVPGDLSSGAFHLVAALLVPGSRVRVERVGLNPTRVGVLGILNRMGAVLEVEELGHEGGEPIGAVSARHGELHGTRVSAAEVPLAIDELPLVALAGCFAEGETIVGGAEELRHKESDRIATVAAAIGALGGRIEARPDGFAVTGTGGLRGGVVDAAGDHRIAMLGAVAGLASREGARVAGFEAAEISYPGFAGDLGRLLAAGGASGAP